MIPRSTDQRLVGSPVSSFLDRSPPGIQSHLNGIVKRQGGKMTVSAAQVQDWIKQVNILIKTSLNRSQQGSEVG